MHRSVAHAFIRLVDTEEIDRCMDPKGDALNFEIYEEPTLDKIITEDAAPGNLPPPLSNPLSLTVYFSSCVARNPT